MLDTVRAHRNHNSGQRCTASEMNWDAVKKAAFLKQAVKGSAEK